MPKRKAYKKQYLDNVNPDGLTLTTAFMRQAVIDSERGCIDGMVIALDVAECFDNYYALMVERVKADYRRAKLAPRKMGLEDDDRRDLRLSLGYTMQMGRRSVKKEYQYLQHMLDDMLEKR